MFFKKNKKDEFEKETISNFLIKVSMYTTMFSIVFFTTLLTGLYFDFYQTLDWNNHIIKTYSANEENLDIHKINDLCIDIENKNLVFTGDIILTKEYINHEGEKKVLKYSIPLDKNMLLYEQNSHIAVIDDVINVEIVKNDAAFSDGIVSIKDDKGNDVFIMSKHLSDNFYLIALANTNEKNREKVEETLDYIHNNSFSIDENDNLDYRLYFNSSKINNSWDKNFIVSDNCIILKNDNKEEVILSTFALDLKGVNLSEKIEVNSNNIYQYRLSLKDEKTGYIPFIDVTNGIKILALSVEQFNSLFK